MLKPLKKKDEKKKRELGKDQFFVEDEARTRVNSFRLGVANSTELLLLYIHYMYTDVQIWMGIYICGCVHVFVGFLLTPVVFYSV